ncbi:hypothetical protein [Vibrio aestuarianus]|uniref:hypothetical protein n=1 Tax=Vibrio aestuarianus TaxID=28171 RepID=UPI00237C9821|nr:hypothetical protein [Vibrio aestuarianus]MDE1271035.1 hypothetical protein [Vibrio aestuarianus]MDH5893432.1 hypothetical protein [Vibrio aestuarianus]WDS56177.1 hypothetical protein MCL29_15395 [Vibrio aestuarianus]WDS59818.1 hypothetical protein MCL31_19665 [Vibrio aestuarianus]
MKNEKLIGSCKGIFKLYLSKNDKSKINEILSNKVSENNSFTKQDIDNVISYFWKHDFECDIEVFELRYEEKVMAQFLVINQKDEKIRNIYCSYMTTKEHIFFCEDIVNQIKDMCKDQDYNLFVELNHLINELDIFLYKTNGFMQMNQDFLMHRKEDTIY